MKPLACSILLAFGLAASRLAPAAGAQTNPPPAGAEPVLIVGDSIMKLLSVTIERDLAKRGLTNVTSFASIGSGLARLDLLDWHAKIKSLAERVKPAVAVILLGSNDNQPMKVGPRPGIPEGSPDWTAEYTRRIQTVLDILWASGVQRVIWVGLPDMRDPALQAHAERVNHMVRGLLLNEPRATFFETQSRLSREPGTFTMYILGPNGMPIHVRASDGIHLSRPGADLLARDLGPLIEGRPAETGPAKPAAP